MMQLKLWFRISQLKRMGCYTKACMTSKSAFGMSYRSLQRLLLLWLTWKYCDCLIPYGHLTFSRVPFFQHIQHCIMLYCIDDYNTEMIQLNYQDQTLCIGVRQCCSNYKVFGCLWYWFSCKNENRYILYIFFFIYK